MKKIIIALLLLATICVNSFAQGYDIIEAGEEVNFNHNEVYLTAGTVSSMGLVFLLGEALGEAFGAAFKSVAGADNNSGADSQSKNDVVFTITGGYNYYFNENFAVGGIASYERIGDINLMTTQAKLTGQYGGEHFKVYHSISAGVMIIPGSSEPVIFMGDLTWLGLKADFKDWNVFVESSLVSTALLKVGASFKF